MSFALKEYFAPHPNTTRGRAVRLSADPTGKHFVYANGKAIVVRSFADPSKAWEYTGHLCNTTVARYSPSGYYIASGDEAGNVRIWDPINPEHILKKEVRPISGRINDIAWDGDSQRVMAVGEGKERFGHVFSYDSGNSVGVVEGQSKVINACSMRQQRPFRAATGSDDMSGVFYHGAPYKFEKSLREHSRFVQDVRYSPSDEYFATVGSDSKIFLYDGKTGDLVRQVAVSGKSGAHKGSIFAVSWSPDSKYIVTSSADKTCKFWDVAKDCLVSTVTVGEAGSRDPGYQQVGNVWGADDHILSLSLSGDFNVLKMDSAAPVRVIHGHQKPIKAAALTQQQVLYTGSYDGQVCRWNLKTGKAEKVKTTIPEGCRPESASVQGEQVAMGFIDNGIRQLGGSSEAVVTAEAIPKSLAISPKDANTMVAVLDNGDLAIATNGKASKIQISETKSAPRAVAISKDAVVAVGFEDGSVHLYSLSGSGLKSKDVSFALLAGQEVTQLAFAPNGEMVGVGGSRGKLVVAKTSDGSLVTARWTKHTARIYSINWSQDSTRAVTSGLDGHIGVWKVADTDTNAFIKHAHLGGVAFVSFTDSDQKVVSAGADGAVKMFY